MFFPALATLPVTWAIAYATRRAVYCSVDFQESLGVVSVVRGRVVFCIATICESGNQTKEN